ncbi:MFS transporter [Streptomyces viridochromogenes]|uniref:MFS transporter n=1 Tax=Streptomyces viridochromogenes TaxID=1938 RepID=UPI00131E81C8|nr:MFS transporter [Streptomyces viridochromogenes]
MNSRLFLNSSILLEAACHHFKGSRMLPDSNEECRPPARDAKLIPLRLNWNFQFYWIGATAGGLGTSIVNLAVPLLILSSTHSPALAGGYSAVLTISQLALGIPAGVVADRINRRALLITTEVIRLLSVAGLVAALLRDDVSWIKIVLLAIALGAALALGTPVRALVLRSIVPPEQLTQALSQDEIRIRVASLFGPVLAGALYEVGQLGPFIAILVGYGIALGTASLVPFDGRVQRKAQASLRGVTAGISFLWRDTTFRALVSLSAVANLLAVAVVLPAVLLLQHQHYGGGAIGFALTGEALGGMVGAFLTRWLHSLMAPGKLLLILSWCTVLPVVALVIPWGLIWVFAMLFVIGVGVPARMVALDIMVFRRANDEVRGRVISVVLFAQAIGSSFGNTLTGFLLSILSPQGAVWTICLAVTVPLVFLTAGKSLRQASWPSA